MKRLMLLVIVLVSTAAPTFAQTSSRVLTILYAVDADRIDLCNEAVIAAVPSGDPATPFILVLRKTVDAGALLPDSRYNVAVFRSLGTDALEEIFYQRRRDRLYGVASGPRGETIVITGPRR